MSILHRALVLASIIFGGMYVNVGVQHFTDTAWFEPIVPVVLGDPTFWVLITGVMEIAIGVGLILPWTRRYAALGSLVFLVGIYSANLNMWVNNIPLDGKTYANHWHVLRLVAQLGMIGLSYAIWRWSIPDIPGRLRLKSTFLRDVGWNQTVWALPKE